MINFLDTYSEQMLLYVVFLILGMTLIVLGIALISRLLLHKRREYRNKTTEQLGEMIVQFVSGELSIEKIKSRLKRRLDFIILLELTSKLEKNLEGKERKRLNELLDIKQIYRHFEKRFYSDEPIMQAKACLYFAKKSDIPAELFPRLVKLTENTEPILCYAAISAVIIHGDLKDKTAALKNALRNRKVSDMALSDLLVQFTRHGEEYHEQEAKLIMSFIDDETVPPQRTAVLIRIFDELEYFHSIDYLWQYYQKLDKTTANPEVLESLLDILTKFGREEVIEDIHHYYAVSHHVNLRLSSARSLGFFRKNMSIPVLRWLINDPDFMVRFEATMSLGKFENVNLQEIHPPGLSKKEWEELAGEVMTETRDKT